MTNLEATQAGTARGWLRWMDLKLLPRIAHAPADGDPPPLLSGHLHRWQKSGLPCPAVLRPVVPPSRPCRLRMPRSKRLGPSGARPRGT